MQEIYQITSALKNLPFCRQVAVLTDARFSGVSTGACIGHISPEALAGGPIGRLREGDIIEIVIDRNALHGAVNFVGKARNDSPWKNAAVVWQPGHCVRIWHPILPCLTTHAYGPRSSRQAVESGEDVSMTRIASSLNSPLTP